MSRYRPCAPTACAAVRSQADDARRLASTYSDSFCVHQGTMEAIRHRRSSWKTSEIIDTGVELLMEPLVDLPRLCGACTATALADTRAPAIRSIIRKASWDCPTTFF